MAAAGVIEHSPGNGVAGDAAPLVPSRPDMAGLSDEGVLQRLRDAEQVARRAYADSLAAIGELATRGLASQRGFGTTKRMVADVLQLGHRQARTRVAEAEQLTRRRAVTGQPLEPLLPATAHALEAGQIGAVQVGIITRALDALPAGVDPTQREWAERKLVSHAGQLDPAGLGRLARRIADHLDPDGPEPDADDVPSPSGELRMRERRNGGLGFEGWLGPEHGTTFRELLERLSQPRVAGPDLPDPRELPERYADALSELCAMACAAEQAPHAAGEPPHVSVTLSLNDLVDAGVGAATMDDGSFVSAETARRWACDAKIIPIVLGGDSEPLDVGRAARTAPAGMRRAVIARDRHCVFPGCNRTPAQCHVHHITHWADGGETALNNLCLLCEHHHRHIHHTGWSVHITSGRAWLTPPAILDPRRRPRTNPLRE